jgi:hypothetical protein
MMRVTNRPSANRLKSLLQLKRLRLSLRHPRRSTLPLPPCNVTNGVISLLPLSISRTTSLLLSMISTHPVKKKSLKKSRRPRKKRLLKLVSKFSSLIFVSI